MQDKTHIEIRISNGVLWHVWSIVVDDVHTVTGHFEGGDGRTVIDTNPDDVSEELIFLLVEFALER